MPRRSDRSVHREDAGVGRRARALSALGLSYLPSLVGPRSLTRERPRILRVGGEMTAAFAVQNGIEGTHVIHVSAKRRVISELQSEFNRSNQRWCRHITESTLGHARYVDHEGDAATGPHVNRRTAAGDAGQCVAD